MAEQLSRRDVEQRIELLKAEFERSEELARTSLDRSLLHGSPEGGFPPRYWARELAVVRGAMTALEESRARLLRAWGADT
jgi:hypothetical protein